MPRLALGPVEIDLARRTASGPGGEVHLTPLEYRVLECLVRQPGHDRDAATSSCARSGARTQEDTRNLRVCIKNLREKLEPDPREPRYLVTETGVGYRFMPDEEVGALYSASVTPDPPSSAGTSFCFGSPSSDAQHGLLRSGRAGPALNSSFGRIAA